MTRQLRAVVVGGSLAGIRAAEAIRKRAPHAEITVIGAEPHFPPIDRPPLSKGYLSADLTAEPIRIRVADDIGAALLIGRTAVALDLNSRVVLLDDHSQVEYDGLVIATGASARRLALAEGHARVHVLRDVDDAQRLRHDLLTAKRVAVIGAGVLGCELAATARRLGTEVALIDVFDLPMLRVLGPAGAELVAAKHVANGVEMHLGHSVAAIHGKPDVEGVELGDGTFVAADTVIVAIGAVPETRWLIDSGLEIDDGVVCDEFCFAHAGGRSVVAAGDVARWRHPTLAASIRVEHWSNAATQGQVAGRNLVSSLTGDEPLTPYDAIPYFWSDQFDWKIQCVGTSGPDVAFELGQPGDPQLVMSYWRDSRLVGALCINAPSHIPRWRGELTA